MNRSHFNKEGYRKGRHTQRRSIGLDKVLTLDTCVHTPSEIPCYIFSLSDAYVTLNKNTMCSYKCFINTNHFYLHVDSKKKMLPSSAPIDVPGN